MLPPSTIEPPGGWTKSNICGSSLPGGNYDASCTCPAQPGSATQCCILLDGTCQQPNAQGQCSGPFAAPSAKACTELSCRRPAITATAPTLNIKFKPQVALPGSTLFNGQEIIITGSTLGEYIAALYAFGVGAIGILATVMVAFGGMQWMLAAGDRGKIQAAKETISSAIVGLILALTAYLFLLAISPKLVRFRSLSLKTVVGVEETFNAGEIAFGARGRTQGSVILTREWLDNASSGVRTKYGSLIRSLQTPQVPEDMIYAIMYVESGGNPNAQSEDEKGDPLACGLMQLKPATANKTCEQLKNPQVGIEAGVAYLKQLANDTCPEKAYRINGTVAECRPPAVQSTTCRSGDLYYVAAAYNGGPGANCGSRDCPGSTWWECSKNSGYQETRNYVVKVEAARKCLQLLFLDPTLTKCPGS
ncbi:MAG: transglycosylase SLT domain-containing protein [Patescibacteria group bacterium]